MDETLVHKIIPETNEQSKHITGMRVVFGNSVDSGCV